MARTKSKKLKSDKKYTDAPRFKVTYGYEDSFKYKFKECIKAINKDISATALKMVKKK